MSVNNQGQATRIRRQMTRRESVNTVVTRMNQVEESVQRGAKFAHTAMVPTTSKQNAERKSIVYML